MTDPTISDLPVALGLAIFLFALTVTLCGSRLYDSHMRYKAFETAQSTILSCRAKAGVNTANKLCGPVPSIKDFQ